ncbi:MAG: PCRF domain-containing protein, partial [Holosporaceae bacterium]|nr:PCRF domain-containing protein [Holosporaceae bacterium]
MSLDTTLDKILKKHDFLGKQMLENAGNSEIFIKLSKEFSDLEPFVHIIHRYKKALKDLEELDAVISDASAEPEFMDLAKLEIEQLEKLLPTLEKEIKLQLLPPD